MKTFSHVTIVDGEPVNIIANTTPGRASGWLMVQGGGAPFLAHENYLAPHRPSTRAERVAERKELRRR